MSNRGGYRPGGGRPKGSKNKANLKIDEILAEEGANLVHQAVRLAKGGNSAVLCKLLDKVLPTISENKNINLEETFEDYLVRLSNDSPKNNAHLPANKSDMSKDIEQNAENKLKTQ